MNYQADHLLITADVNIAILELSTQPGPSTSHARHLAHPGTLCAPGSHLSSRSCVLNDPQSHCHKPLPTRTRHNPRYPLTPCTPHTAPLQNQFAEQRNVYYKSHRHRDITNECTVFLPGVETDALSFPIELRQVDLSCD